MELLQVAVAKDLKQLFEGYVLKNSRGMERELQIYIQDPPVREGYDEEGAEDNPPEPYVIIQTTGGETPGVDAEEITNLMLIVGVCEENKLRKGCLDVLRIIQQVQRFYARHRITGRRYEVQFPLSWAINQEDTHPYYFGVISLRFIGTTIFSEEPNDEEID